jgi:hypothetical protein
MKQLALKKSIVQMKGVWFLLSGRQEEKEPSPPGHRYGNGIRMQRFALQEDLQMFAHPHDLPVSRAKIFLE